MTILIVDDEFRIGQLIRRLIHFEELGLELIDVFDDSEKALGAILLHHPDVVISDIKMPGMDGLELVRRTQEAGIASRFVFVSGFREFEYAHKALQYGVEDYLLKPVKEEDLNNILQKLSDGHEQVLQHRREEKQLQEEARRGRYIRGFDLIQAIESAGEWVDWQELNRMMQSNVQNGKMLAFLLQLDYYDASQQDDIQDRMVINNLITMTEDRLRPHLYEQLYAVQDKTLMIGLLNYAPAASTMVRQELYTVYADVRRYLSGFPEYVATLAFGEEITPQQGKLSLQTARQRMNWRIALGANRIIGPEHFVTNPKLGELVTIARAQLQNAVEALNAAAASRVWQDLVRQIQSNPQNDPALYYTLARCFLNTFYGDLTWDERRTRQCRNWLEQVRHCWQLPQLNELVEQAIAEELQTQQKELDNQTARPVRMALDYIAENYAQKIGLDEIAEMLQMNSSYFSTLFKKETGRNFQNYLTEYRIEKAKELLRTTNETMMSVAEQVGYQDTRYFSQCFVKVVGVKPSLYRKMYS